MAKIVVVTDLHYDKLTLGVPRFGEVDRALEQATVHAIKIDADAFLCLGDIADPDNGGAVARAQACIIESASRLSQAEIPNAWIAGNHDVYEDGSGATVLTPLAGIEKLTAHRTWLVEDPCVVWTRDENVPIVCLPYAPVARAYAPHVAVKNCFEQIERTARQTKTLERIKIVVAAHLMIPGVVPGEETLEMPRGRMVAFPLEETKNVFFRMNGHYHRRQEFDPGDGGPPIHIPGAPAQFCFGDEGNACAFSVIDI